jgi:hypothetical protein
MTRLAVLIILLSAGLLSALITASLGAVTKPQADSWFLATVAKILALLFLGVYETRSALIDRLLAYRE